MKKNKRPQLLLPCYEHWYREWVQFYKNNKWVQYEGSKQWYFIDIKKENQKGGKND